MDQLLLVLLVMAVGDRDRGHRAQPHAASRRGGRAGAARVAVRRLDRGHEGVPEVRDGQPVDRAPVLGVRDRRSRASAQGVVPRPSSAPEREAARGELLLEDPDRLGPDAVQGEDSFALTRARLAYVV